MASAIRKVELMVGWLDKNKNHKMGESNLNVAVNTPVEELTEEQKQLIRDNVAALSDEEKARFTEAGILSAETVTTPEVKGDSEGGSAEGQPTSPDGGNDAGDQPASETEQPAA